MKAKPIIFSGPMVRAILDGKKTQTRRPVKPQQSRAPWRAGEQLYVRETFAKGPKSYSVAYRATGECGAWFWVDGELSWLHHGYVHESPDYPPRKPEFRTFGLNTYGGKWKPSIHMPRWASRIALRVAGVRAERLNDINDADCMAEGSSPDAFRTLWDSIYKAGFKWDDNPWVWVCEFERVDV